MCASSRRLSLTGNAPTGITTGTNRWWSSPTRKRFPSNRPPGFRPHKAASPVRSTAGRIPRRCANRGFDWHPPVACPSEGGGRTADRSMKAHMIKLPGLGRQARLNVAQAFPVRQLGKCHRSVLFGTRQCLNREITTITRDQPRECAPREAIHQLGKNRLSDVHLRALPGKGSGKPPPPSSRHHQKSPKSHYKSDTSRQFVRKTPDSSGQTCEMLGLLQTKASPVGTRSRSPQ